AMRAQADAINKNIDEIMAKRDAVLAELNEIHAKQAEAAAWIEKFAPDADVEISGVEKLPLGHIEKAQISYSPIVYEITQEMSVAMLSDDLIASVLDSITVDGLELFIFKGTEGSTCAGYRKDGVPYKFLTMAYPDGVVTDYSLAEFENVLGHSGFVIEWGSAHKYRYYYTVSPVGEPNIFLPASGEVHETDYDRDGIVEIIASETAYSKVYDLFFEEEGDEYGFVSEALLSSEKDKTGYLYKYDAEKGYFVFSYNKADSIAVYKRYGIADGSRLTLSTPFEDMDIDTDTPNENVEIKNPVDVTYMNIDRPVNTVLIPLSGADPRFQVYRYDDRYTVYVTCDMVTDRNGEFFNADSKIVVVDNEKGQIVLEYEIGDLYGYPNSSYGLNCMYLFSVHLGYEESPEQVYIMDYAYKIDFTGGSVTVSDGADEFDWYKQIQKVVYTSDGKTAAVMTDDSLWNDGGVDIHYPDGRVERILDSVYWNGETVTDINDVIGYTPEAFIDDTHLVYSIGGWEWRYGFGIYDLESGESWESEKNYRVLGVHD
ncbi:MAG: hypothetical protein IKI93_08215, partial [Clostridia bacterium]|nr:hypothetical protein [Clostridia bacterium]